jgi:hypothetical protein
LTQPTFLSYRNIQFNPKLGSLSGIVAEGVDVGDEGFTKNAFFEVMFGDFDEGGFGGLEVAFGVEKLLAQAGEFTSGGRRGGMDEFAVDNFNCFGFSGDIRVLLLKFGEGVFQVLKGRFKLGSWGVVVLR